MILDCTLRDGGYYTDWNFSIDLLEQYWMAVQAGDVQLVEVGFRNPLSDGNHGIYYYSPPEWFEELVCVSTSGADCLLGVMINGDRFASSVNGEWTLDESELLACFPGVEADFACFVRIAVTFENYKLGLALASHLRGYGYTIGLNLMQIHRVPDHKVARVVREISQISIVDWLYFADSFGNLLPSRVGELTEIFRANFELGKIGFHSHDNRGLAFANCLVALEKGIDVLDGTVLGMGRGAGNVRTESLVSNLSSKTSNGPDFVKWSAAVSAFQNLKDKYRWGSSVLYEFAAVNNIHPSYVQLIESDPRYSSDEKITILKDLVLSDASSFSAGFLEKIDLLKNNLGADVDALLESHKVLELEELACSTVLIIGAGQSVVNDSRFINKWMHEMQPHVLVLNGSVSIPEEVWCADIYYHPQRAEAEFSASKHKSARRVILPDFLVERFHRSLIRHDRFVGVDVTVEKVGFTVNERKRKIPNELTLSFALHVAVQMGATRVYLAGCDGFENDEFKTPELLETLAHYRDKFSRDIVSLTPTKLPLRYQKPFLPDLSGDPIKTAVVIPARSESSRFPNKPLCMIGNLPMIEHVRRACLLSVPDSDVYVATDNEQIKEVVESFGGRAILTSKACRTGTDRVAEAAKKLVGYTHFINVQGDEVFLSASHINTVLDYLQRFPSHIINGYCEVQEAIDVCSPNVPKVVVGTDNQLIYMSRSIIPSNKRLEVSDSACYQKQVCIYGFNRNALESFAAAPIGSSEAQEDIEILRFLELGMVVKMVELSPTSLAVDVPEDAIRANQILGHNPSQEEVTFYEL